MTALKSIEKNGIFVVKNDKMLKRSIESRIKRQHKDENIAGQGSKWFLVFY